VWRLAGFIGEHGDLVAPADAVAAFLQLTDALLDGGQLFLPAGFA
jgi:hypothetical protein